MDFVVTTKHKELEGDSVFLPIMFLCEKKKLHALLK
jgi:hypothetical protein